MTVRCRRAMIALTLLAVAVALTGGGPSAANISDLWGRALTLRDVIDEWGFLHIEDPAETALDTPVTWCKSDRCTIEIETEDTRGLTAPFAILVGCARVTWLGEAWVGRGRAIPPGAEPDEDSQTLPEEIYGKPRLETDVSIVEAYAIALPPRCRMPRVVLAIATEEEKHLGSAITRIADDESVVSTRLLGIREAASKAYAVCYVELPPGSTPETIFVVIRPRTHVYESH